MLRIPAATTAKTNDFGECLRAALEKGFKGSALKKSTQAKIMEYLVSENENRKLESLLQIGTQEVRSWDFRASVSRIAENDYSIWLRIACKDKDGRRMRLKPVTAEVQIDEDISQRTDQKGPRPQSSNVNVKNWAIDSEDEDSQPPRSNDDQTFSNSSGFQGNNRAADEPHKCRATPWGIGTGRDLLAGLSWRRPRAALEWFPRASFECRSVLEPLRKSAE